MCKYCDIEEDEEPCDCICIFEKDEERASFNGYDKELIEIEIDCNDCEHEKKVICVCGHSLKSHEPLEGLCADPCNKCTCQFFRNERSWSETR